MNAHTFLDERDTCLSYFLSIKIPFTLLVEPDPLKVAFATSRSERVKWNNNIFQKCRNFAGNGVEGYRFARNYPKTGFFKFSLLVVNPLSPGLLKKSLILGHFIGREFINQKVATCGLSTWPWKVPSDRHLDGHLMYRWNFSPTWPSFRLWPKKTANCAHFRLEKQRYRNAAGSLL